jgi:alkylation response protein AidB-like acyl-CoA dehydrogenase
MPTTLQRTDVKDYLAVAADVAAQLSVNAVSRDVEAGIPAEEVRLLKESGLLLLPIPQEYGGAGRSWTEIYRVIQTLASAQGSVGQLYANHVVLVIAGEAMGRLGQAEQFYRVTAQQNLLWANALNARDARLKITREGEHFRVNGVKSFGTGVAVADMNAIAAIEPTTNTPMVFVIPKERAGVRYNQDWDNLGQRRTVSGSYTFENVLVTPNELLGPPPVPDSIFPTLIFLMSQMSKTFTYLGIAEGALAAAREYTCTSTRAWMTSGVESAAQDPFILHHYGEFWAELQAAIALANQAAAQIQVAWEKKTALTFAERGELAVATAAAKAVAIKAGLNITNHIFDVMGARATASSHGFDRFWRDLRTFSLHDPVDYKYKDIGNWFLNQEYPMPSQYS